MGNQVGVAERGDIEEGIMSRLIPWRNLHLRIGKKAKAA